MKFKVSTHADDGRKAIMAFEADKVFIEDGSLILTDKQGILIAALSPDVWIACFQAHLTKDDKETPQ